MKTIIIYDNSGKIYITQSGNYEIPQGGIQYIETEVPNGKCVKSVEVSVTPNVPVLEDIPKSEIEILKDTVDALVLASLEG